MRLAPVRTMMLLAVLSLSGAACGGGTAVEPTTTTPGSSTSPGPSTTAEPTSTTPPISPATSPTTAVDPTDGSTTPPVEGGAIAGELDAAELGAPYLGALTFDWPQDCSVSVVEEVLRRGDTAELRWNLGLTGVGQDLLVSFDELEFTSVNGTAMTAVESAQLAQLATAFALPSFMVGSNGTVVDIVGMEDLIAQLEAASPDSGVEITPGFIALLEQSVTGKYWDSWAGLWASWGSFESASELGVSEQMVGDAVVVSDVEMSSLGTAAESLVALRSTVTLDGDDFELAVGGAVGLLGSTDQAAGAVFEGQRVVVVEAVTDPTTLRPASVFISLESEITLDGTTTTELEQRRWSFDWIACA